VKRKSLPNIYPKDPGKEQSDHGGAERESSLRCAEDDYRRKSLGAPLPVIIILHPAIANKENGDYAGDSFYSCNKPPL
jgi:hypothetical protein